MTASAISLVGFLSFPAAGEQAAVVTAMEEVVVYGRKVESTRTPYDIKIRGVGRNFRSLGGDPGVGTYYNGIYSPDFGIAATENALFDIQRIEVLRGPQGTLYGRNSAGGVLNYVTNQPNREAFEGQARVLLGDYHTREFYGFVSGPATDRLAYRLVGMKRLSNTNLERLGPTKDTPDPRDQNFALTLDWQLTDSFAANLRYNDRHARYGDLENETRGVLSEGPCIGQHPIENLDDCDPRWRVTRDTNYYASGLRVVDADFPDAFPYVHPVTGETVHAHYLREGVDPTGWPFSPAPNWHDPWVARYDAGSNKKPDFKGLYNFAGREFDQQSASLVVDWTINDRYAFKYLGNYQQFEFWFDQDNDASASELSSVGDWVVEAVRSVSHELRFFWDLGQRWSAASGVYYFKEDRDQHYAIRNRLGKGYLNNPTVYGPEGYENWVRSAFPFVPDCFDWRSVAIGKSGFGAYCGDTGTSHSHRNDIGAAYEHDNNVVNDTIAFYTQGDLQITDTLSVTLGARYSEDTRDALEQRGGYTEFEFTSPDWDWVPFAFAATAPEGFDAGQFFAPGVTPLAALNVAMGAATFTGDPDNPIAPVCPLDALSCDRPLRLGGLPLAWGGRAGGDFKNDSLTWRVNLNWEPTPNALVYAGVTTGYRAGGFALGGVDNRAEVFDADGNINVVLITYDDEEITAYEVGYKGTQFDGRLRVNASVYYYDYRNYQDDISRWESESASFDLPAEIPAPAGRGPVITTTTIPEAHNVGFETDFVWLATRNLTVGGNYSFTVSEWDTPFTLLNTSDPRYPLTIMGGDLNQDPCTLPDEVKVLYCLEVDGQQLSGIPKHKGTLWGAYEWRRNFGTFIFQTSIAITGSYYSTNFRTPWVEVPTRHRTDMRLTFDSVGRRWSASLFVDNVFDDTYLQWTNMGSIGNYNFTQDGVALSPRLVGLDLMINFGDF